MLDYGLIVDEAPGHCRLITPPKPVGWWIFPGGCVLGNTMISCYEAPGQHIIDNMLSMLGFKYERSE